jgi:hypothetical protein
MQRPCELIAAVFVGVAEIASGVRAASAQDATLPDRNTLICASPPFMRC